MEAGIFLETCQVQGNDRHLIHSAFMQSLPDKVDIVGSPAPAPGLYHHESGLVDVIFAAFEGVDKLPYAQQRRVAGVIMGVPQPLVLYPPAHGGEQLYTVAVVIEASFQKSEMDRQHIGDKNGIFLPHFLGEQQPSVLVINKLCHRAYQPHFTKDLINILYHSGMIFARGIFKFFDIFRDFSGNRHNSQGFTAAFRTASPG